MEEFYENGNIRWRAPYVEDKEDGIAEEFDEQGNITETTLWKNGELIEETEPELTPRIEYYSNGNVWIKGQKNSKGQHEGIWEWFYKNGNIRERMPFKAGKMDGIEEWFYPKGKIRRRTSYVGGLIDGVDEWFYENGNTRFKTTFKDGNMDGTQNFYDEQGYITETRLWKDGILIKTTKH